MSHLIQRGCLPLILGIVFLVTPAYSAGVVGTQESGALHRTFRVTLTTYWAQGKGTDRNTAAKRSSTGIGLKEGVSVAVDPQVIPYGTVLFIPGVGVRVAVDTGSDVVARRASRMTGTDLPVVDVYFDRKRDAQRFAQRTDGPQEVVILGMRDLGKL